jgi:hypothetical protein
VDDRVAEPAALMVLASWTEPDGRWVVRVTRTVDVRAGPGTTSYARSRAEVLDHVGRWLDALVTPP